MVRTLAEATFEKHLKSAMDDGLAVLGESVRDVIYYYIERDRGLARQEFPGRFTELHEYLRDVFGGGAKIIEKLIAKNLYDRLGLAFEEQDDWTLPDYVNQAKRRVAEPP